MSRKGARVGNEASLKAEQRYFREHPTAWYYVRRHGPCEAVEGPLGPGGDHILVVQLAPGVRFRTVLPKGTDVTSWLRIYEAAMAFRERIRERTGWEP